MKHINTSVFTAVCCMILFVLSSCNLEKIDPVLPPVTFQTKIQGLSGQVAAGYDVIQSKDSGYVVFGWTQMVSGYSDFYVLKFDRKGVQQWARNYGSGGYDFAYQGVQTTDGGYIIAGESDSKFYVFKIDANGNQQWSYVGDASSFAISLTLNTDGSVLAVGNIYVDAILRNDIILVKLNASGNLIFNRRISSGDSEYAGQVISDPAGGYMLAGNSYDGATTDGMLMKIDANGAETWRKRYDGSGLGYDNLKGLVKTSDGGYILVGNTETDPANTDIFVVKTDATGTLTWKNSYGNAGYDAGEKIVQLSDGTYVLVGSVSFSSFPVVYLTRILANGSQDWIQTYDLGEFDDFPQAFKQTIDKGFILTGSTYESSGTSVLLIKTDEEGNL